MTASPESATTPKPKPKRRWLFVVAALLFGCCLVSIIAYAISQSAQKTTTPAPTSVGVSNGSQALPTKVKAESSDPQKPTEPPAPTKTVAAAVKDIYKVGEKANAAGIAITILNVQKINKLELLTADPGKTYLDIEVLIENVSRDVTTPYNSLYFKVKDDTAAEYTPTMDSLAPSLKSGDLVKGDKARGHVAFEIPDNVKGLVVSYEPMVIFGGYKTIRVNTEEKTDTPPEIGTLQIGENQVGQRFESAGIAITVTSASTATSLSGMPPNEGMVYLDIEVMLENASRDEDTPYNPLYFKIKDEQFLEYNTAFVSLEPSLTSGNLVKGDKVRGHVAFQVPANGKKFVVSYEPEVLFGGYKPIAINVVLQ